MLSFSKIKVVFIYIIFILISLFAFLNLQNENYPILKKKVNLGLDLQGGSYLLLEIDTKPLIKERIQSKVVPLKKLLNKNNFSYTNFIISSNRISLNFNNKDIKKFEKIYFSEKDNLLNSYIPKYNSFELDFKLVNNSIEIFFSKFGILNINNLALSQSIEIVRRRIDDTGTKEPTILQRGDKRILVELPGIKDPERIKNLLGKTAQLNFRLVSDEKSEFGFDELISEEGEKLIVNKRIIVSGENLLDAQPRMDSETNQTVVTFTLDRVGAKRFGKATTTGIGKQMAIVLDGKIISAPVIQDAIVSGSGQITGGFTFQTATDLALLLRSGALPAPLNIIEERTVGPDLGEDSIKAGLMALLIGFLLVISFMLVKYKIFGLIANTALILNLLLLIGILTLFEATLTLPGIAGIILTVGMAVDANVLIFERIKEELSKESKVIIAIRDGFTRAISTILDANITTLIAALLLFIFGSGPIKGFSITLSLGVLSSMFTAIMLTNFLVYFWLSIKKEKIIKF